MFRLQYFYRKVNCRCATYYPKFVPKNVSLEFQLWKNVPYVQTPTRQNCIEYLKDNPTNSQMLY